MLGGGLNPTKLEGPEACKSFSISMGLYVPKDLHRCECDEASDKLEANYCKSGEPFIRRGKFSMPVALSNSI